MIRDTPPPSAPCSDVASHVQLVPCLTCGVLMRVPLDTPYQWYETHLEEPRHRSVYHLAIAYHRAIAYPHLWQNVGETEPIIFWTNSPDIPEVRR